MIAYGTMRILVMLNHVLTEEIGSGGDIVGIELARRWQQSGHAVHLVVAAAGGEAYARAIRPGAVTVLPASSVDHPRWYFQHLSRIAFVYLLRSVRAVRLLKHLDADVVYTPGDFWCDVLPASFKKRRQPGTVFAGAIFHINEAPHRRKGNSLPASVFSFVAQRASFSLIKRYANVVFALNSDVRAGLLRRGFAPERVHVLGAGLDLQKFAQASPQEKRTDACYLGRINPTKGVFDLPAIWSEVVQALPGRTLVIMGRGSAAWERQLRAEIVRSGVGETVEYLGYVSSYEAMTRLQQSRVLVSASTEEGFGMSIAEAFACGVPAVAYDLPAYREFFPRGLTLVPMGDHRAFAHAVLRLLKDEAFYAAESAMAKAVAARYDWDRVAEREIEVMEHARSAAATRAKLSL